MTHLTHTVTLPDEHTNRYDRILQTTEHYSKLFLDAEYWTDDHLRDFRRYRKQTSNPAWKYIDQHITDPFDKHTDNDTYLYSRYKRCIYARIAQVLDAHADEQQAYAFLTDTLPPGLIHETEWDTIRTELFAEDTPYIGWKHVQNVVEMLDAYYRVHGDWPDAYTELIGTPSPNGTTPFAPDGRGDIHTINYLADTGELELTLNTPDSYTTTSYHDWTKHTITVEVDDRFKQLLETGEVKAPTLRKTTTRGTDETPEYVLDIPVEVESLETNTEDGRVLAVDLGVKK